MTTKPPQSVEQLDDLLTKPTEPVLRAIERCDGDFAVLGAGGKMGFHVTRMLQRSLEQLGRANRLIAVSRFSTPASREPFQQHRIDFQSADLSDAGQVADVARVENVVYLAGVKFGTSGDNELLHRMNVTMPKLVSEHFFDSRIVALSTGCVYSFVSPESGGSTEQSEIDPPGQYAASCVERERAFVDGSTRHGTPCVLVRLNYSNELRYGVLVDIAQQVQAGRPVNVETGFVNVIWQGDAVAQILQCLPLASSPPVILNITGLKTLSVRDLADQFGGKFGRKPKFVGSEAPTCWLSDSSRACRLFGSPAISEDCMIAWIADWLRQGLPTLGKPTQFQNRDGNY